MDFGTFRPERPFQELVLKHLRPGDIYTHAYLSAVPLFDDRGTLLPYLSEARKRGVIFDVGHGAGVEGHLERALGRAATLEHAPIRARRLLLPSVALVGRSS